MCSLITPSVRFRGSFLEGAAEFFAEGRLESTYSVCLGYDLKALAQRFDRFIEDLLIIGNHSRTAWGHYVDRVLWLIDGDEYIGQTSIRPELCTRYLITYGGHIGYSIRPSRRMRGHGKKILALSLDASREMDLKKVLVTCDSDNIPSRKIIEHNGGLFESTMKMNARAFRAEGRQPHAKVEKLRYWIDLKPGENGKPRCP